MGPERTRIYGVITGVRTGSLPSGRVRDEARVGYLGLQITTTTLFGMKEAERRGVLRLKNTVGTSASILILLVRVQCSHNKNILSNGYYFCKCLNNSIFLYCIL